MNNKQMFLIAGVAIAIAVVVYFATRSRASAASLPDSGSAAPPTEADRNRALATTVIGASAGIASGIAAYA